MMTKWLPDISKGDGPIYIRLADRLEDAIASGTLPAGAKLPPQRNIAFDLGVTIGTISRAYSLLHERGLVSGEVGRGTFVLKRGEVPLQDAHDPVAAALSGTRALAAPPGKIRLDSTAAPEVGQSETLGAIMAEIIRECPQELSSYTRTFPGAWHEAGATWLAHRDFRPAPETIVPTLGAHAGIMAVISAVTSPGDRIVFEHLTYSQISRAGALVGRRASLVEADDDGVLPDDFERVCQQQHPKIAFFMSSAQNPTLATMPEARRRAIADIARRNNVWLIEDNLYGGLAGHDIPMMVEFAPERTFVVDGLSKSVSAGVRGGWVACPPHFAHRVRIAHKMMTGGLPFLLAEAAARLVNSGLAAEIRARCLAEIAAREAIARTLLAGHDFRSAARTPFLWLRLPEPWLSSTFKNAAFDDGVLIDDEAEFKAGRSEQLTHRVRIGFSSPQSRADVREGLTILRRLLDNASAGYDSVA